MSSLFTQIINGEIPAIFVHRDSRCVSFMTINPIARGHLLVVPIEEIDQWSNLPDDLNAHLFAVAANIGRAQKLAFKCNRVGLIIAGYEIPHCHLHLIPTKSMADFDFDRAAKSVPTHELESAANEVILAMKELEQGL